jgi:hypothetical protein
MRLALVALLVCATAPARAEHDVGVVVTGEATIQPQVATELESWLSKAGHRLVDSPLPPDAINTVVDCFVIEDEGCARGVVEKRSKLTSIVYARADVQSGSTAMDRDVTLTAYWFERGKHPIKDQRICEKCTADSLRKTADELMSALANKAQKTGRLQCTSTPAGAVVSVDGKRVGVTPLAHDLTPGPHRVYVTHERSGEETRNIVVTAGETVTLDLAMRLDEGGGRGSRFAPKLVLALGAASVLTGGVLLFFDEKPDPQKGLKITDTTPWTIGLGGAGAALLIGGTVWYVKAGGRSSTPVATVSSHGGYVGWVRRF